MQLVWSVFCLLAVVACAPAAPATHNTQPPGTSSQPTPAVQGEVAVFSASSLTDAFREIGEVFQKANPGSRVAFNFGASTQLRTQLEQGARGDVFATANQAEMDKARQAGLIGGVDRTFARNRLAVIFPRSNPGNIMALKDMAKPGLKFVSAAPEVPIGVYTQEMLDRMTRDAGFGADFRDRVNANIVSREPNVRQVVTKIALGEADFGVVYSSDVTPDMAERVTKFDVPDSYNTLAAYPIAAVMNAANAAGAEAFVSFVQSSDGQALMEKWGFITDKSRTR